MKHMIRYKLKADRVDENERLSRAVYDALRRQRPAGVHYATFKSADGVSFVHLVAFSEGVKERCVEPPLRVDLTEVGSYGFFSA